MSNILDRNFKYDVALGNVSGYDTWNKFGYNADVDSASEEVIASFGGTFAIMTTDDNLDVVSTSANDTNSAGTGARQILLVGIDGSSNYQTETVNLNGTTTVTTSNTWLGINRAYVISSGTSDSNEGTITINASGVGDQAQIPANEGVTQQCIFHTEASHTLLTDWLYVNINKISGGSSPVVTIYGYSYSRIVDCVYEVFRTTIDTNVENTLELTPSQPFVIGGNEVLYFTADTNTNNTVVSARFSGILQG